MRAVAAVLVLLAAGAPAAAAGPTYPSHAEALYRRYCASCHGVDGRGNGPVAAELKTQPPDLTRGNLGLAELMKIIDGRRTIRAHGSADMPVWGQVFEASREGEERQVRQSLRDVQALAEYVRALQAGD